MRNRVIIHGLWRRVSCGVTNFVTITTHPNFLELLYQRLIMPQMVRVTTSFLFELNPQVVHIRRYNGNVTRLFQILDTGELGVI